MKTELKKLCGDALEGARQGLAWIGDPANAERVGVGQKSVTQQLRKSVVSARKALAAIDRPMCVSVFGPSQAGKSYLVSVLARHGNSPLMAKFGDLGREVDFIREINPGGDRESTGLVTRFSIRPEPSPPGAPVVIRMLSEGDVAKILGNSFYLDSDPKKRPPLLSETVLEALNQARSRAGSQGRGDGMSEEDVWEIQEYFEKQFAGLGNLELLSAYWEEAATLAPRLSVSDRADLFSVLWGSIPKFTELYRELASSLERIGFPKDAYCPIESLVPRDKSIIDVETLAGLGMPGQEELPIRSMNGPLVPLPRPVVTALAAELRITISDSPWPFFEHTDLLDFPGARSRQKVELAAFVEDNPEMVKEMFRRGKVAYLFDRYVAEQELSSMLLCIKPSNQEVVELPDMIDGWIQTSHGATPADRAKVETALFLVLTMMDAHFTEKAGQEGQSLSDRFQARMGSSLTSFFGKAHRWPFEWTPGRPFDNTYWLRNPNFKSEFMIRYDRDREVEILPDKLERVAALRSACLDVGEVQSHFRDPGRAFDEAMKLNDGGVNYLAENLAKVCRPEMKCAQIRERVHGIMAEIRRLVSPYFVDSDIDKRLEERQVVSGEILSGLSECWGRNQFGSALRMLQISQNAIAEHLHVDYGNRLKRQKDTDSAPASKPESGAPPRPALPGGPPIPGTQKAPSAVAARAPTPSVSAPAPKSAPRGAYLAKSAMRHWTECLFSLVRNDEALQAIGLTQALAGELVAELILGARRTGLEEAIARDFATISTSSVESAGTLLEKAGFFATTNINRFVSTLGFDKVLEEKRPKAPDGTDDGLVTVFARRGVNANCDALPVERKNFAYLALSEWMYAFHHLVIDNVMAGEGFVVNVEQNEKLRAILAMVEPAGVAR
ncbi:virulence factor SrfC family protein [Rhizobium sp. 3T7]|uniref:virulence factor SrfC family protein n=1 Tax=Rhizobium sp. 3T7 TaxID=2874922 RepID=UPI001CCD839B|nr:virulence factor SrfC family protein [Rhizobium sp. 3T7]MBZ9791691.1 virulence factor SrfC family protein [Rhizobium sp. 3T7]